MDEPRIYTRKQMIVAKRIAKAEGRKEAEEFLQERIVNVKNIIADCVDEIFRLDKTDSVVGVTIPLKFAEKLVRRMIADRHPQYAKRLEKYIDESSQIDLEEEEWRALIAEIEGV